MNIVDKFFKEGQQSSGTFNRYKVTLLVQTNEREDPDALGDMVAEATEGVGIKVITAEVNRIGLG